MCKRTDETLTCECTGAILTFLTFRDKENKPTCSLAATKAGSCHFLAFSHFGQQGVCVYPTDVGIKTDIHRDKEGTGYLRPHSKCPFWKE